jgi:hypothetical protein
MSTNRIKAGEKVQWKSQAQGGVKQKSGTVIAFVPRMASARELAPTAFLDGARTFRRFDGERSAVDRYVVKVLRFSATSGAPLPAYYYAPLASVLERQNPSAVRENRR